MTLARKESFRLMQFNEDNKLQFTDAPALSPLICLEGKKVGKDLPGKSATNNQRCQIKMLLKLQQKLFVSAAKKNN